MKKMRLARQIIALALTVVMLLGFSGCFKLNDATMMITGLSDLPQTAGTDEDAVTEEELLEAINSARKESGDGTVSDLQMVELSREELELIVDILDEDIDTDALDDKALSTVVDELLNEMDRKEESSYDPDVYDEDGGMKVPFDIAYPELVEKGEVEYSEDALLIKLENKRGNPLSKAIRATGVVELEEIVPMEKETWYKASLKAGTDTEAALSALRELKEVKLAEYDYQIRTAAIDKYEDLPDDKKLGGNKEKKEQWYLHHFGIPKAFKHMKTDGGDHSVVVAVIDTGVDYDHEDLKDNIWKNTAEVPDNGIDDDKNGYIDDYYGVDIVAGKGNGDDDNGHGTHVAGIIAADNNNVGTVGIAYNVTVMPVKAAMASGYLNQSDVAKGILYAYENGAEVINMSFGGSACSIATQDALATAYTRCVLVASAGNDGENNEPTPTDPIYIPNYPAALTYVLGVMSVDSNGVESSFTNYDVYPFNGVEYELYAPGSAIMSTLPNDKYGVLSGTSMAAPVVSAMAAILRSEFEDRDMYPTKFIYGQLASTSEIYGTCLDPDAHGKHNLPQVADLYSALTKLPKPDLGLNDYALFDTAGLKQDTAGVNNGDGVIDAGETIALGLTLRNRWGMSEDTTVTIDTLSGGGVTDPYITVHNPTVDYGSVGTYSTGDCGKEYTDELHTGWKNPFYITVAKDCPNDYIFKLNVTLQYKNGLDENDKTVYEGNGTINLTVRNGVILPAIIDEDMTLTPDNLYIIPNATVIKEDVTVKVQPGTHIQFWSDDAGDPYADTYIAYLKVNGEFLVEGTKEAPVYIYPSDLMSQYNVEIGASDTGYVSLRYADIANLSCEYSGGNTGTTNRINYADHCTFRYNYGTYIYCRYLSDGVVNTSSIFPIIGIFDLVENSVFYKIGLYGRTTAIKGTAKRCIFADCGINYSFNSNLKLTTQNCVFLGNTFVDQTRPNTIRNSSMTAQGMTLPNTSNVVIYYREETGTYYLKVSNKALDEVLMEKMGITYTIIETEDEFDWLASNLKSDVYRLPINYDRKTQRHLWYDGTEVGTFLDYSNILRSEAAKTKQVNLYRPTSGFTCLTTTSCSNYFYELKCDVLPTEIKLARYEVNLDTEVTYQIVPKSKPKQLGLDRFIYESSNESVLAVSDTGLVTPLKKGTADVTVWSKDKAVKNYITFNISDYVALESVAFIEDNAKVAVGESVATALAFAPANTTRQQATYTSSDENVVTVDTAGVLTGVDSGTVTITATCEGKCDTITVTSFVKATSLELKTSAVSIAPDAAPCALPEVITSDGAETDLVWRSVDESVATVENGKLAPKSIGTTTLQVTDRLSGLSATALVVVQQQQQSPVVKYDGTNTIYYALLENGDLYRWNTTAAPECVLKEVKDFSAGAGNAGALLDDGTVMLVGSSKTVVLADLSDAKPYKIMCSTNGSNFVLTEDGKTLAWGTNSKGQLGLGSTASVNEPTSLELENIKDVCFARVSSSTSETVTYFLTEDGKVYYAGNGQTTPKMLNGPIVEKFSASNSYGTSIDAYAVLSSGNMARVNYSSGVTIVGNRSLDVTEFSDIVWELYGIVIKDSQAYELEKGSATPIRIPGAGNIEKAFLYNYTYYLSTSDGFLLGLGVSYRNRFMGVAPNPTMATEPPAKITTPVVLPLIPFEDGDLVLKSTSLNAESVNVGEELALTFNKALRIATPKLYADGVAVNIAHEIRDLNQLVITNSDGWKEGVTYTLTLDAGTLRADGGTANSEVITIEFTYSPEEVEDIVIPVIHESVLDPSIERIYTLASFISELQAVQAMYQCNETFYNNAILNRISTDTTVEHWLRIVAPEGEGVEIPLGGNYWGTTNEKAIGLQIIDYTDFISYGHIQYAPYLTEAPEDTFPFITSLNIYNKAGETVTTVGNEEIRVRITFNRDMDTSIPLLVRFGSAYPYGDYEIEGVYTDARTWEGTYKLTTLIENGLQYFTISNGCSATDDLTFCTDRARFGFVIDTTAAQALIMQGQASENGIKLWWTQDDFDTLMGYNVYRATSEDGLYTRLNSTVIPADQMEFFDDTVEPGVRYYYNFTVVKTDLSESVPSGKITIMSMDTMAPNIYHSPVYDAFTGQNLVISATVTDNLSISNAKVYYRTVGESEWRVAVMNHLNDKYSAIIIANHVNVEGLEYYIEAYDGISYTYKGSAENPYTVTVREAISTDALGDVNGDGAITNLDALMLLQAINDQLNLDAEQFARADLDGDEILSAKEALRILQYVSGTVGSVNMRG